MSTYSQRTSVTSIDGITLSVFLSLLFIGWLMLTAVNFSDQESQVFSITDALTSSNSFYYAAALVVFFIGMIVDYKFWNSFSWVIYGIGIFLLIAVLLFGNEVKGATSWFSLAGFSFQPSEFAKWSTVLMLSSYLGLANVNIQSTRNLIIALGILFLPVIFILLQPDAGSALVFMSLGVVFYRAGMNPIVFIVLFALIGVVIGSLLFGIQPMLPALILGGMLLLIFQQKRITLFLGIWALLALFAIAFGRFVDLYIITLVLLGLFVCFGAFTAMKQRIQPVILTTIMTFSAIGIAFASDFGYNTILKPHQQDRINVWLHPDKCDPQGSLYNVNQSKTAIGSGGVIGKGFLEGTMTKLNYVPEQSTDFIFSTLGEEQGFIGALGVLILFFIMLVRLTVLAERSKNDFIKYYGYGIAAILFFQVFVNIGMTMGIMPVIGIPLPFISKGGTALVIFSFMIGSMLRMDMDRNKR